jgi:Kdo2-lipid IVA lauroyltransferase/acyltransferase
VTAILRAFSFFLCLLPESLMRLWAWCIGVFWFYVVRYRRGVMDESFAIAFPELGPSEHRRLGRRACVHLVRTLFEFLRIPRYRRKGLENVVRIEGLENFEKAKARGKGVLCLSGHLGSFELCVAAVAEKADPVSLVVKPFPPAVDRLVAEIRGESGLKVIYAEGAVRPILKALHDNESVVFVLDQNATRSTGVFVDFFGKPASTMTALAVIAERTGAAVIAAVPYRDENGEHVLEVHPEIPLEPKLNRLETVQWMTQRYTTFLEEQIKRHPEQWFWTHKRWRTRPVGNPNDPGTMDLSS